MMKNLKAIFKYAHSLRRYILIVTIASIAGALLSFSVPFILKLATDYIVEVASSNQPVSVEYIMLLATGVLVSGILSFIISDIGGYYGDVLATKLRRQLSESYYKHLLGLPLKYYDNEVTGKIINRLSRAITDITQFINFFSNNLMQMLLMILISVGVLTFYYWPLALLVVVLIPIYLGLTAKTSVKWQDWEHKKNTQFDIASGRFAEVVNQVRLVKSFGSEKHELNSFSARFKTMISITKQQSRYWHFMNSLRGISQAIVYTAIYGLLFYRTATGAFSVGDLVLLVAIIQQAITPLRNMSFFIDAYQRAAANSKDYIKAMAEEPEQPIDKGKKLNVKSGLVEFSKVDFSYNQGQEVLKDISFIMKSNSSLALVGESGGGKTTISNLLMQLYEPTSGQITIDGQPLHSVSRASVRDSIATVFQDASLFSGTIRENIAYGKPGASDEQVKAAAKAANALKFIEDFDSGFETEIGERGIKLSGGQKQRISIARALLKDSPILILDEATSSLDSRAEAEVQVALKKLMKGRTVLIIAHRLSTISYVDTIVTLKNGQIDEVGSPKELALSGGIYSELLSLQKVGDDSDKKALAAFDIVS